MKKTIGLKMTVLFVIFSLVLCLALSIFSYFASWESYIDIFTEHARSAAEMTASLIDGTRVATYLETNEKDYYYDELKVMLNNIKRELDIMYLYIFKPGSDSFTYIIEAQLDTDDPDMIAELGNVFEYTRIEYDYLLPDVEARRASTHKVVSYDEAGYGNVVSAWAPVFSDSGELVAMVEADVALTRVEKRLKDFLMVIILLSCSITVLLLISLLFMMRRIISRPLERLTNNALGFVGDDTLSEFADDIKTGDEMQTLSESFSKMAQDIKRYTENLAVVVADKERIATELNVATQIQISMLPYIFPAFPDRTEFNIYASMTPAKEVGGDFYDFFLIDENTIAVVIADVSGKGVPAALFMVIAKTLIKNNAQYGKSPKEVFETVNNLLCENNDANMFVTAILGYLDIPTGKFVYVNAGHNFPLLRANRKFDWLKEKPGFVLAGMEDMFYKQYEVTLSPGDEIFLYTDGVTEAINIESELFSDPRLHETVNRYLDLPLREFTISIKHEIDKFAGIAEQADDITMLALRYNGVI